MSNTPKRPSQRPLPAPSDGVTRTSQSRAPGNLKDALTEARAITGAGIARPSTAPQSFAPGGRPAKKTILLVDDDASMRQRLRVALEPFYEVIEAKDGMEAAELAATIQPPAMIVCDVVMPRVDGFTLAKILRSNPIMKRVPIMFVSSRNSPQDVTHALMLGACQYVQKSTPVGDIVAKIRKIVV